MSIVIVVYGSPAPQGSKKFVGLAKSGRGILAESSKKVKPWRQDVKSAAEEAIATWVAMNSEAAWTPLDGPLLARVVFTLPKPGNAPKRKRTFPCKKPDLSKLLRSTEDALTDAGLIADDARLVEFSRLAKVFPGEDPEALHAPGVRIVVEMLEAA